jgi:hypothetical protein
LSILAKVSDNPTSTVSNLTLDGDLLSNNSLTSTGNSKSGVYLTGMTFSDFTLTGNKAFTGIDTGCDACTEMFIGVDQVIVVPVPASVWLFGSGLPELVGITRRKKSSSD